MLELIGATDRLRSATEYRFKAANASLVALQTDDLATKREWNLVARDWNELAITASAQEGLANVIFRATVEQSLPILPASLHAAKVLLVEGNAVNQSVLTAVLRLGGIEPVIAGNGEEAVAAWDREAWDVILMDVQMPVLDGISATRAIRLKEAASERPHTPIVAVAANVLPAQVRDYYVNGMDDVIAKPIDIDRLFAVLTRILAPAAVAA